MPYIEYDDEYGGRGDFCFNNPLANESVTIKTWHKLQNGVSSTYIGYDQR